MEGLGMSDARIPDHAAWAARGYWRNAYDALQQRITELTAENEEFCAALGQERKSHEAAHNRAEKAEIEAEFFKNEVKLRNKGQTSTLGPEKLADAFDCVWNAAIGESHRQQDGIAFASILAESFRAMAQQLREGN